MMSAPNGFPDKSKFTPVPNLLFGQLLEEVIDVRQLKCLLRLIFMIHQKKGFPRFITWEELISDRVLRIALSDDTYDPNEIPNHSNRDSDTYVYKLACTLHELDLLGLILSVDKHESIGGLSVANAFLINNEEGRRGINSVRGRFDVNVGIKMQGTLTGERNHLLQNRSNIFSLYEENIGIIGHIMAEELKEAEKEYPESWLNEAFKEAVVQNKRNWSYIKAILHNWTEKGKGNGNGEFGRHSKKVDSREWIRKHGLPKPK